MTSCCAVLTFRRQAAIQRFLETLAEHQLIGKYPIAVFEDCGNWDNTVEWLTAGSEFKGLDKELNSDLWIRPDGIQVFIGRRREGVAGQSNKALRWFERQELDHLCLCNDDLLALGDFVEEYAKGHTHLGIDFLTYSGYTDPMHQCTLAKYRGKDIRVLQRMVGGMLSLTKAVVKTIGYMSMRFGNFGNEHCEINNRARRRGFIMVHGQPQTGVDIVSKFLTHQDIPSSILPFERPLLDSEAETAIQEIASETFNVSTYVPFRLRHPPLVFGYAGLGIPIRRLERLGYLLVNDPSTVAIEC